ncbi:Hypothetical predicted protein [Mytilus galloprovincialis]|uniref:Uncharacterized protein n=1 Tax=Mytilus galloprovincialis TaxID=29158 RepID=A0A8B6HBF4_MYTGA|nr:Hypothetical predicted protein [Mytilus galloprovincialis]
MTSIPHVVIWLIFCIELSVKAKNDPCLTTNQISEWKRSISYGDTNVICDSFLYEGWYKVTSGAGEMMPTECPKDGYRCGTADPYYLSREDIINPNETTFPTNGETVDRVACSADLHGNCCKERINIKIKDCDNLPCPAEESSENGFSPGCGTHPNVTVPTPLITTGLYYDTSHSQEHNRPYTYHTVQFQCHTNVETKYTYDVRWYIDDFEITEAARTNVDGDILSVATMLRQHHWEQLFKPNMMVQCSIQVREVIFTAPGPRSYSAKFFAGITVGQNNFRIKEGDNAVAVPISLTIPIGCSYPTDSPQ